MVDEVEEIVIQVGFGFGGFVNPMPEWFAGHVLPGHSDVRCPVVGMNMLAPIVHEKDFHVVVNLHDICSPVFCIK